VVRYLTALAIGFGAQSLLKDYFTEFFILFEDQIRKRQQWTVRCECLRRLKAAFDDTGSRSRSRTSRCMPASLGGVAQCRTGSLWKLA
jgi:hypothetical protein